MLEWGVCRCTVLFMNQNTTPFCDSLSLSCRGAFAQVDSEGSEAIVSPSSNTSRIPQLKAGAEIC